MGEIALPDGRASRREARTVHQPVAVTREVARGKGESIAATCLVPREFDAPAGVKPIEWRLPTNRAASTSPVACDSGAASAADAKADANSSGRALFA